MEFRGQVISAVEIHLTWKDPVNSNGIIRFYYIEIYDTKTGQQDRDLKVDSQSAGQQDHPQWVVISHLKPYINYTFTIQAVTIKPGEMANFTTRTDEGVPSQPRDVTAKLVNDAIDVTWKDPKDYNGIITKYAIYCNGRRAYNKSFQQNNEVVLDENARSTLIKKGLLKPGTEYSVYVRATTVKGYGSRSDPVVLKTPSKAPPPPQRPQVVEGDVTPTTITISLTPSSDTNGEIIYHQIIVEMLGLCRKRRQAPFLPEDISGYGDAEANGDHVYIAAQFERGKHPAKLVLGNGKTYGGYENAPLKPETRYMAYIRGVTQNNGEFLIGEAAVITLPTTGSLLPTSNPSPILEDESTKCSVGWVIAVVVQGIINAILTAIVVFGFMRWRQPTNKDSDTAYYETVNPADAAKHLGLASKEGAYSKGRSNRHLQQAEVNCEYAMLDRSKMQENDPPVYTALAKSRSTGGQMQHLEDESKTYYNIQGLRQDSDKHPTYEDVSKE